MSHDIQIFIGPKGVPSVERWQKAIDDLGFHTNLDPAADIESHSGFWPATFDGRETGFEFRFNDVADVLAHGHAVARKVVGSKKCASFTLHGDVVEMCAAMEAAAALAKLTDGWYHYPDDDLFSDADQAVVGAREAVEFIRAHLQRSNK